MLCIQQAVLTACWQAGLSARWASGPGLHDSKIVGSLCADGWHDGKFACWHVGWIAIHTDCLLACWPVSNTVSRLASKLVGRHEDRQASQRDGWTASKQADKKSGLPSGWPDGWLMKNITSKIANLSHPPDWNGSSSFALCEGHLTANFYTHQVPYFRVYCLARFSPIMC